MRTADAISPVPAASIAGTLALFVSGYGIVFSMGIYYINRLIKQGPRQAAAESRGIVASPLSAAQDARREALQRGHHGMVSAGDLGRR